MENLLLSAVCPNCGGFAKKDFCSDRCREEFIKELQSELKIQNG